MRTAGRIGSPSVRPVMANSTGAVANSAQQQTDQFQRRRVCPVHVLELDQQRLLGSERHDMVTQNL